MRWGVDQWKKIRAKAEKATAMSIKKMERQLNKFQKEADRDPNDDITDNDMLDMLAQDIKDVQKILDLINAGKISRAFHFWDKLDSNVQEEDTPDVIIDFLEEWWEGPDE